MKRKPNKKTFFVAAILLVIAVGAIGIVTLTNSNRIAVLMAPEKQATKSRSENAKKADELFWQTFHNGEYEKIQPALDVLTAAYLETQRVPKLEIPGGVG